MEFFFFATLAREIGIQMSISVEFSIASHPYLLFLCVRECLCLVVSQFVCTHRMCVPYVSSFVVTTLTLTYCVWYFALDHSSANHHGQLFKVKIVHTLCSLCACFVQKRCGWRAGAIYFNDIHAKWFDR